MAELAIQPNPTPPSPTLESVQPAPAPAVARPEYIPEALWDGEKNAPKADFAKDYEELNTLRSENEARVKDIPQDGAYKFELPEDFKLPDGVEYKAPPQNDPEVTAFFDFAKQRKWPQSVVRDMIGFDAQRRLGAYQAAQKSEAARLAEFKTLGENASVRAEEAGRWLNANLSEPEAKAAGYLLHMKDGVTAVEKIIEATKGVKMRGLTNGRVPNPNAGLGDDIGRRPVGTDLLRAANSQPH